MSYNKTFKKAVILILLGITDGTWMIFKNFVTYYPQYKIGDSTYYGVTVSERMNISTETRVGGNIYGSFPFASVFNIRSNISLYNREIRENGPQATSISSFEYRITLNFSYQILKSLALEIFGNFNSARTAVQGKVPSWTSYSFAIRKKLFHDNASIAFTTNNPFDEYVIQKTSLTGQTSPSTVPANSLPLLRINLTYKFGKMKFRNEREDENNNLMNGPGF